MKHLFNKLTQHASHVSKHVKKHKQHYLFGTFGSFAIVKMLALFVGFFGIAYLGNTYAQMVWPPLELNSTNITLPPFNCATDAISCDLTYKDITSIAPDTFINHTNLTTLFLYANHITSLASGTFNGLSSLTYLNIYNNQITSLEAGDFNGLSSLHNLDISSNLITSLGTDTFNGLPLTYLELMTNHITSLEAGDFNGLSTATGFYYLGLQYNRINAIASNTFYGLSSVSNLYLNNNNITSLGTDIFSSLSGLTYLYLQNNQIASLASGTFNGLSSLTHLNIYSNQITSLEVGTFNGLSAVTELQLYANQLTSLSADTFNGLSSLTYLALHDNLIASIETNAFNGLSSLNNLQLYSNRLTSIEDGDFNGPSALLFLGLHSNQITGIENSDFNGLSSLYDLNLGSNLIASLTTDVFNGLSSLTQLQLYDNKIVSIENGDFNGLDLSYLQLSSNLITSLQSGDFNGLTGLTTLILDSNPIISIEPGTFNGLSNLTNLQLSNNLITSFIPGTFNGLSSLTSLYLNNGQLTSLSENLFSELPSLVDGNLHIDINKICIGELNSTVIGLINLKSDINWRTQQDMNSCPLLPLNSTSIIQSPFNCATNATSCNLSSYGITSIAPDTFINHASLQDLILGNNRITSLEASDFNGLSSLTNLYLYNNRIASLTPGTFNGVSTLLTLSLDTNRITSLASNSFDGLPNLTYLSLNSNQIASLASGTFNGLPALTYLDIGTNQITALVPGTFNGLPMLNTLYLYNNQLSSLPESFSNEVSNLSAGGLDINNNEVCIGALSPTLLDFVNFTQSLSWKNGQDMRNCPAQPLNSGNITQSPFNCAINAISCDLSAYGITSIAPDTFINHTNLQDLSLNNNKLTSLQPGTFSGLSALIYLYLNANQIISLDTDIFNGLSSLLEIYLNNNQITSLDASHFNGLPILQGLYINDNKITSLVPGTFDSLTTLNYLQLNNNNITSLETGFFNLLPNLVQLNLGSNCNTNGVENILFGNGLTTQIDGWNCLAVSGSNASGFITDLQNQNYVLHNNYYVGGIYPLSFNKPNATNTILAPFIMQSYHNFDGNVLDRNPVEVQFDAGTDITYNGQPFTGILYPPMLFPATNVPGITGAVTLMKFGSLDHGLDFSQPITIRMPALGRTLGENIGIYSSDVGTIYGGSPGRAFKTTGTVITYSGALYLEFTTTHASRWVLKGSPETTGSFVINNNDASTVMPGVALNITGVGITNMRFANDSMVGIRSDRVPFTPSTAWVVSALTGTKRVFAEFDTDNNTGNGAELSAWDSILYLGAPALPPPPPPATGAAPSFTINNNAASSILTGVTLNITGSYMNVRFQNESGVRGSREPFMVIGVSKAWILSDGTGMKTVNAEFDTDGNTATAEFVTSDLINYIGAPALPPPPPPATGGLPSFTINNNDPSTLMAGVSLNMTGAGTYMRFQNDAIVGIRSPRTPFMPSTAWALSAGTGTKRVFAQFDTDNNTGTIEVSMTSDSINYMDAPALPPPGTGVLPPPGTGVLPPPPGTGVVLVSSVQLNSGNIGIYGCSAIACNLSGLNITSVAPDTFINYPGLSILNLSNNHITSLEAGVFNGLPLLITLILDNNAITSIPMGTFNSLPLLTTLSISNNQISSVQPGLFNGLSTLTTLNLNGNQITAITVDHFSGLLALIQLDLGNNCNTNGTELLNGGNRSANIDNHNCLMISSATVTGFVSDLTGKSYILIDAYYVGTHDISLSHPDASNEILVPVIMESEPLLNDPYYTEPVEILYPAGTHISSNGNPYTGILYNPTMYAPGNVPGLDNTISVMKFGSLDQGLDFDQAITLRIPAPGKSVGEKVKVYSSETVNIFGNSAPGRNFQQMGTVVLFNSAPYVIIPTLHASRWALESLSGTFVINNDAASTTGTIVVLNITGAGIINMQFSNDNINRSSRTAFATTSAWTLSAGTGNKTVYAQFDIDNDLSGDIATSDAILYTTEATGCVGAGCGDITLRITSNGVGYCEIGDSVDFGLTGYSASSRTLQSLFPNTSGNNAWFCNDLTGKASRTLDISSSDLFNITTNNPVHTIAGANVFIKNPAATVMQGICTANPGSSLDVRTSIGGINVPLLGKTGNIGEVCRVETSQVELRIQIPAYQALGQYSGTLTITVPDLS